MPSITRTFMYLLVPLLVGAALSNPISAQTDEEPRRPRFGDPDFGTPKQDGPRFGDPGFGEPGDAKNIGELSTERGSADLPQARRVESLASPAAGPNQSPSFAVAGTEIYLIWVEGNAESAARPIKYARFEEGAWKPLGSVSTPGNTSLDYWQPPQLAVASDGAMVAAWIEGDKNGTQLFLSTRPAGAESWGAPQLAPETAPGSNPSSCALLPPDGGATTFQFFWKDHHTPPPQMPEIPAGAPEDFDPGPVPPVGQRLLANTVDANGFGAPVVLDQRACESCALATVRVSGQSLLFYRDVAGIYDREIAFVGSSGSRWTDPVSFTEGGGVFDSCPHQAPVAAVRGEQVAVAWYSEGSGVGKVLLRVSRKAGEHWSGAMQLNSTRCRGYIGAAWLANGTIAVAWQEAAGRGGSTRIFVMEVDANGKTGQLTDVTREDIRLRGAPQLASVGDNLFVAWSDSAKGIRTVKVAMPSR